MVVITAMRIDERSFWSAKEPVVALELHVPVHFLLLQWKKHPVHEVGCSCQILFFIFWQNDFHSTPLGLAISCYNFELVKLMLDVGSPSVVLQCISSPFFTGLKSNCPKLPTIVAIWKLPQILPFTFVNIL